MFSLLAKGRHWRHCACGSSPVPIPAPKIDRFYRLNNSGARKIKDYHIFPKQTHFTSNVFRCSLCQEFNQIFSNNIKHFLNRKCRKAVCKKKQKFNIISILEVPATDHVYLSEITPLPQKLLS